MLETYSASLIGLWLVLTTITLQAVIATGAHRRQSKWCPAVWMRLWAMTVLYFVQTGHFEIHWKI